MREAWPIAALGNRLGHDVLLADMALRNVLDGNARGFRNLRRVLPHLIAQRGRELRIIENKDAVRVQKCRHPLGVADTRNRTGDDNPIVTRKNPCDPLVVAFSKPCRHRPLANWLRPPV